MYSDPVSDFPSEKYADFSFSFDVILSKTVKITLVLRACEDTVLISLDKINHLITV